MPTVPLNYVAVACAAAASIVLGFLWYGPLFGKPWMAIMGVTKADKEKMKDGMMPKYVLMVITSLITAFVMSYSLTFASAYLRASGTNAGLMTGFWNWLGFVVPVEMGSQLWEGKPWKLFWIQAGYYLVSLCLMGVILANWA